MIICDVCWCVMGQSDEHDDLLDQSIKWIGRNCLCFECFERYEKIINKDRLDRGFRKN